MCAFDFRDRRSGARAILLGLGLVFCPAITPGAEDDDAMSLDWWAYQPVTRPDVPRFEGEDVGAIDAFVRSRLAAESMTAAPHAKPGVLVRRVYFDLIGLPPSAEEVERFFRDPSDAAYGALVDRLLASERFGERWARHWLDVVRFAETNGYERDALKPNFWKYRDWVIGAFNDDMPYDRFVREQLAGDEIPERTLSSVIATGMLRAGTWNDEPNEAEDYMYERLEDMVDVVSTAFLGVTVRCARCHDHKFDPIPQRDYYRMAAAFWPGAIEPRDSKLMGGPSAAELGVEGVFGWTDIRRDPPPLHLLENGETHRKGEVVPSGNLSLAPAVDRDHAPPATGAETTGRRHQLAAFITHPDNPLTSRVMVNRLWQHLTGRGIVGTPNNFGRKADPPTHPALLDWLAADFVAGGWKLKRMVRQIVLSSTYRQSSLHPEETAQALIDPGNLLLWKMNRRRLDAESLRDSMLTASGELNLKSGGPSFYPVMAPEVLEGFSRKGSAWEPSPMRERMRRSVYMVSKRHLILPLMTAFDFPNTEKPCGRRDVTTVAPQALALLNNPFVHARSEALARRILETGDEAAAIRLAWRSVLGRDPAADELAAAKAHWARQRRHFESRPEPEEPDAAVPVLRFDAGGVLRTDGEGRVERWNDGLDGEHDASQPRPERRPSLVRDGIGGQPSLRFIGSGQDLYIDGQVLKGQDCTIVAVASDRSTHGQHREIFSNWNGKAGNSTTSLFLGLTGEGRVRFSDDFVSERAIANPGQPFILAASSGARGAEIWHNGELLAGRDRALATRRLDTPYVIGQQGNIDGEYWEGDIAVVLVYRRQMAPRELRALTESLAEGYGIELGDAPDPVVRDANFLAAASLCHVLMNSNAFLYVD